MKTVYTSAAVDASAGAPALSVSGACAAEAATYILGTVRSQSASVVLDLAFLLEGKRSNLKLLETHPPGICRNEFQT